MPDFDNLPLILAGPLLRRVEPGLVSIWVALSKAGVVELGLWTGTVAAPSGSDFFGNGTAMQTASANSIRVGEKLHLALVALDLSSSPLIPGQIYSYNLVFDGTEDLNSLGLLTDEESGEHPHLALGYLPNTLPSFAMPPPGLEQLKIVQGSCRKAHGHGPDALAGLDKIIEDTLTDPTQRPHQLFLTGDQIYADDVAAVLLPELNEAGNALLGVTEELVIRTGSGGQPVKKPATLDEFRATWRQQLVAELAKFTSSEAHNHVLSFGEFCALYLFYWSNVLWPDALKGKDAIFIESGDSASFVSKLPPHLRELYPVLEEKDLKKKLDSREELKDKFKDQTNEVKAFRKALPNVQRALANIVTYMIFDDHEVTDDWYLTQDWRDRVLTAPLGVNVLRNAMLSYALFQHWGNDPKKFADDPDYAQLLSLAQQLFPPGATGPVTAVADQLDVLFGFDGSDPKIKWHYRAPSGPTQTVVLDTRTRREYTGRHSPPGLLSPAALEDQLPPSLIPTAGAQVLIVVSPAPVLGLALIEELAQPLAARAFSDFLHANKAAGENRRPEITGHLDWDMEAWALGAESFEALLDRLHTMKKVILLSGDVHFAYSAEMDYWQKDDPEPSRIVQLVSSSSKNEPVLVAKRALSTGTVQRILHNAFYPAQRLAWEHDLDLDGEVNVPGGIIPATFRALLNRSPVLLPTRGWPAGTTIGVPPDWSWRMSLLKDERPDNNSANARPADGQPPKINPDIDPDAPEGGYVAALLRHEKALAMKTPRSVLFNSNIGIFTFSNSGGTLMVKHDLLYQHPEGAKPDDPKPYTAHQTRLTPSIDTPPAIE